MDTNMSATQDTTKKNTRKKNLAVKPTPYLVDILKSFGGPLKPATDGKAVARFEWLRGQAAKFSDECVCYAQAVLREMRAMAVLRPTAVDSPDHLAQMQRGVMPIFHCELVVVELARVMAQLAMVVQRRRVNPGEYTDRWLRGIEPKRQPDGTVKKAIVNREDFEAFRAFTNFRIWLYGQTEKGKKRKARSNEKYRKSDAQRALRATEAFKAAERHRRHVSNYKKTFRSRHGFELIGPVPPARAWTRKRDAQPPTRCRSEIVITAGDLDDVFADTGDREPHPRRHLDDVVAMNNNESVDAGCCRLSDQRSLAS